MRTASLLCIVVLHACPAPTVPPDPVILPAEELAVEIESDILTLEGNLTLPARTEGQDVPAIVLVHGSGPQSRDEVIGAQLNMAFGFDIPVFAQISKSLQEDGIAVLRYDKRSCTSFNNTCDNDYPLPESDIKTSDFATDAVVATTWLADQEGIDPERIFVVGHSQGGALMPAILAGNANLAGGVSLAGNFRPIDVLLRFQLDSSLTLLESLGYTEAAIDDLLGDLTAMVEALEALRAGSFVGTYIGGLPVAFWEDAFAIGDARPGLVAQESRPMLAINGDTDTNIPHDPELVLWEQAGVDTLLFPCVTHALNCVGTEIGSEVEPALLSALSEWLLR